MNNFEIGEIVIYVRQDSPYYGEEVEITGPLLKVYLDGEDHVKGKRGYYKYCYEINSHWATHARPEYLRKKKPPQELSTWEDVQKITNWNPTKVLENA